jgi:hypothetical protein
MNWFRENPFWRSFAAIGGGGLLIALVLFWWSRGRFNDAAARYRAASEAQRQLESSNPYPNEVNVRKMKQHLADYRGALDKIKAELAARVIPTAALPPNEFQTRLRQAILTTIENARVRGVKLPGNFNLGFPEFIAALPTTGDAPKLGRELAQIQLLLNTIIDARVDAITMFRRGTPTSAVMATPTPTPKRAQGAAASPTPKPIERTTVEFTISAAPSAARKIINQISSADEQFFIIRTLHVKNQKDKGPSRESATAAPAPAAATTSSSPPAGLNFIVGNEHIDLSARVELIDFAF